MWVKVDDALPEHRKVIEAGRLLGRGGTGRVLAIWVTGMCYSNRNLTDGFLPEPVIRTWVLYDARPLDVTFAMVSAGLLTQVEGGYQFHDYGNYQPSAADVKAKRERDRLRKKVPAIDAHAVGILRESGENSASVLADVHRHSIGAIGKTAKQLPKEPSDSTRIPSGIQADSVGIPERSRARDPDPARSEDLKVQGASRRLAVEKPSVSVLTKLVHSVLDEEPELAWMLSDLVEEVKCRAARAHLAYDSSSVRKAMDSAEVQRKRRAS